MSQFQHFICYAHVLLMLQHPRFPGNRVAFLSCKYGELDSQEHMHVHPWAVSFIVHRPNYRTGLKTYLEKKYEMAMYFTTNFACISVSFAVYIQFWSVANQEKKFN